MTTEQNPLSPGEHRVRLANGHTPEGGLEFRYTVSGQGPVLVMPSAGWGIGSDILKELEEHLSKDFTIVRFDTRGSGESERPELQPEQFAEFYDFNNFKHDLEALRQHLGLEKIGFAAHSMATTQALDYAANYPDHVSRMILFSALPLVNTPERAAAQEEAFEYLGEEAARNFGEDTWYPEAKDVYDHPERIQNDEQFREAMKVMAPLYFVGTTPENIDARRQILDVPVNSSAIVAWTGVEQQVTPELLTKIPANIPTLVINGEFDPHSLRKDAEDIGRSLKGARVVIIPGGAHLPWIDAPEQLDCILTENHEYLMGQEILSEDFENHCTTESAGREIFSQNLEDMQKPAHTGASEAPKGPQTAPAILPKAQ